MNAAMTPIVPISASLPAIGGPAVGSGLAANGSSGAAFQSVLSEAVQQVEQFQNNSAASIGRFVSGEGEELHQVALAGQQADLAFDLFMQVRNKVISAYQEVMRMQV